MFSLLYPHLPNILAKQHADEVENENVKYVTINPIAPPSTGNTKKADSGSKKGTKTPDKKLESSNNTTLTSAASVVFRMLNRELKNTSNAQQLQVYK